MSNDRRLFTIGHSDHELSRFLNLLIVHGVTAVADVRSMPYSRFNPQFNRDEIQAALKDAGVGYVFLGEELGARRSEPECYIDGKARYELIAKTPAFRNGLNRLKRGSVRFQIALMCAEKDPLTCHRAILVSRLLRGSFLVSHILDSGQLEMNDEMERRLLKTIRMNGGDLFNTEAEAIEQAYDIQGDRIAYIKSGTQKGT